MLDYIQFSTLTNCAFLFVPLFLQINEEFTRITTVDLEETFIAKLDQYSPKIMSMVFSRGRSSKRSIQRIKNMLLEV